jgi:AbiTii
MQLLDEIIELAVDGNTQTTTLLRKCLLLARRLKNARLREWVEKELNGYEASDELPDYRRTTGVAKGLFLGPFNSSISDQPLPAHVLRKEHRHWASEITLRQPIVAYERNDQPKKDGEQTANGSQDQRAPGKYVIPWPAGLVVMYQAKFIEDYALNRAWLEIPTSTFPALIDTVRNKVLMFALDLKDDLGDVGDDIDAVSREKIDSQVVYNIYGGTNIVANSAQNFTQVGTITVNEGDAEALRSALRKLGISESGVSELKAALAEDESVASAPSLGQRTKAWLTGIGSKVAEAGANIAVETAKAEATKYLLQYLGLS